MAAFTRFEEIGAWRKARELTREIYRQSNSGAFSRDFAFRDQMRRAAVSIMSNIAEGFERGSDREFGRFVAIARGSSGEIRSQLYIARDLEYIDPPTFKIWLEQAEEIGRMLFSLRNYLRSSDGTEKG